MKEFNTGKMKLKSLFSGPIFVTFHFHCYSKYINMFPNEYLLK